MTETAASRRVSSGVHITSGTSDSVAVGNSVSTSAALQTNHTKAASVLLSTPRLIVPTTVRSQFGYTPILPKLSHLCEPFPGNVVDIKTKQRKRAASNSNSISAKDGVALAVKTVTKKPRASVQRKCDKPIKASKPIQNSHKILKAILPKLDSTTYRNGLTYSIVGASNTMDCLSLTADSSLSNRINLFNLVIKPESKLSNGVIPVGYLMLSNSFPKTADNLAVEAADVTSNTDVHLTSSTVDGNSISGIDKHDVTVTDDKPSQTQLHSVPNLPLTSGVLASSNSLAIENKQIQTSLPKVVTFKTGLLSTASSNANEPILPKSVIKISTGSKSLPTANSLTKTSSSNTNCPAMLPVSNSIKVRLKSAASVPGILYNATSCGIEEDEPLHESILNGLKYKNSKMTNNASSLTRDSNKITIDGKDLSNEQSQVKLNVVSSSFKQPQGQLAAGSLGGESGTLAATAMLKTYRMMLCQVCGKMLQGSSSLKSHLLTHSTNKPHECSDCFKTFRFLHALKAHLRIHTNESPYACPHCPAAFKSLSNMKRHGRLHDADNVVKEHVCAQCAKRFNNKWGLNSHNKVHRTTPSNCSECGKSFNSLSSLKIHKLSHRYPEKQFSCNRCDKVYIFRSLLKRHLDGHNGVQKHTCHICSAKFIWKSGLLSHLQSHFPKKFKCRLCSSSFRTDVRYKAHLRRHSNPQPHVCSLCLRKFAYNYLLVRHIKSSHGHKAFIAVRTKKLSAKKYSVHTPLTDSSQVGNDVNNSVQPECLDNILDISNDVCSELQSDTTESNILTASTDNIGANVSEKTYKFRCVSAGRSNDVVLYSDGAKASEDCNNSEMTEDWMEQQSRNGGKVLPDIELFDNASLAGDGNQLVGDNICENSFTNRHESHILNPLNLDDDEVETPGVRQPPPSYTPCSGRHVCQTLYDNTTADGLMPQRCSDYSESLTPSYDAYTFKYIQQSPMTSQQTGGQNPNLIHANDPYLHSLTHSCFSSPHYGYYSPQPSIYHPGYDLPSSLDQTIDSLQATPLGYTDQSPPRPPSPPSYRNTPLFASPQFRSDPCGDASNDNRQ